MLPICGVDLPLTRAPAAGLPTAIAALPNLTAGSREVVAATLMRQPVVAGLPRYMPRGPAAVIHPAAPRDRGRVRGKTRGKPLWAMEVAVLCDLYRCDRLDLSTELGLSDHLTTQDPSHASFGRAPRTKGLERYLSSGRQLLHSLGAWPWAHAWQGRLPSDWTEGEDFSLPLWRWQWEARVDLQLELLNTEVVSVRPVTDGDVGARGGLARLSDRQEQGCGAHPGHTSVP